MGGGDSLKIRQGITSGSPESARFPAKMKNLPEIRGLYKSRNSFWEALSGKSMEQKSTSWWLNHPSEVPFLNNNN